MTKDQIRIKVAEELGWKQIEVFEHSFADSSKQVSRGFRWHHPRGYQCYLPDYINSLDACVEFEKTITNEHDQHMYLGMLGLNFDMSHEERWRWFRATPLQRCEAFLRLRGKWEE